MGFREFIKFDKPKQIFTGIYVLSFIIFYITLGCVFGGCGKYLASIAHIFYLFIYHTPFLSLSEGQEILRGILVFVIYYMLFSLVVYCIKNKESIRPTISKVALTLILVPVLLFNKILVCRLFGTCPYTFQEFKIIMVYNLGNFGGVVFVLVWIGISYFISSSIVYFFIKLRNKNK